MDADTRLLRYFAAVAEEGNITRAAERLFVSQPALTKQIRQLESRLGVPLFSRSRAGMALTPAGQALAGRVPAVLAGWDEAVRETRHARPGIVYRPVTGVSPSHVGVAWPPAADASPVVQDFVRCCRDGTRCLRTGVRTAQ